MTRQQQLVGKHGQQQVASLLNGWGLAMVEQIGTPIDFQPYRHTTRKDVYVVHFGEKVSGDHRAILPGGRSVLVETKTVYDRNLRFSDLRSHQPDRLSLHAGIGGLSLLCWVAGTLKDEIYVMEWGKQGIEGFTHGKSISVEKAKILSDKTTHDLRLLCDVFYK